MDNRPLQFFHLFFLVYIFHIVYSVNTNYEETKSTEFKAEIPALICEAPTFSPTNVNGTFLHITDIHIDTAYKSNSDPEKLCHRSSKDPDKNIAGEYGILNSRCDTPIKLVEESFRYMKDKFSRVDFVIYTGDSVRHNRDKKQKRMPNEVLLDHQRIINYFNNTFDLRNTLVIPTIGNNDAIEHNRLSEGLDEPLYKFLLKLWGGLPGLDIHQSGEARESFLLGGYWVQTLPKSPKVKVINLNSMFLYVGNRHTPDCRLADSPGGNQLKWLEAKLEELQKERNHVYIMGHVPPNNEEGGRILLDQCYKEFIRITGRFSSMIISHFWGHVNADNISILTQAKDKATYKLIPLVGDKPPKLHKGEIVNVMLTAPSITPVHHPAIRHFVYSPPNGKLLGYTQYYANLSLANQHNSPGLIFKREYDTWSTFNLPALTLPHWRKFIPRLIKDKNLWALYSSYQTVGSPKSLGATKY